MQIKEQFPETILSELKKTARTWPKVFDELGKLSSSYGEQVLVVFDEIQWIAKQKSGFAGVLKHYWSEWKQTTQIKLILCGSSNKFFTKNTDGEFNSLRGLKTFGDIWVRPFSLQEVKESF